MGGWKERLGDMGRWDIRLERRGRMEKRPESLRGYKTGWKGVGVWKERLEDGVIKSRVCMWEGGGGG